MNALITGANRGIGLAITQELIKEYHVIAICRNSSPELEKTGAQIINNIDITDVNALETAKKNLKDVHLNLLINNAGILQEDRLSSIDYEKIIDQFSVNTLGALKTTKIFLPLLQENSKVIMITSRMGSITDNSSGGYYGYRISKAAMNMMGANLAIDLRPLRIAVGMIHPGYVKTNMTSYSGDIDTKTAAQRIIHRIEEISLSNSGSFWHSNGETIAW